MAAANLLFMGFLYSPEAATRPVRALFRSSRPAKGALHQVSRKVSDTSVSATTDGTFSRNTSSGQESLLDGLVSPQQRISPKKASSAKASPSKSANGVSGPCTPRTLETDPVEAEADLRHQMQALKDLAEQRDGLASDLKARLLLYVMESTVVACSSIHDTFFVVV